MGYLQHFLRRGLFRRGPGAARLPAAHRRRPAGQIQHRSGQDPVPLHPRHGAGGEVHPWPVPPLGHPFRGRGGQRGHGREGQQKSPTDQRPHQRVVPGGSVRKYPHGL